MPSILCLGDSLTAGDDQVAGGFRTYRGTLQTLLSSAGITPLDFVGPERRTPASGGQDPDHAAWGGAYISNAGGQNATNNLTDRLASLKTDYPSPDLIVVYVGWNDVYNQPGTIASRYATFIGAVQSGVWASVKAVLCTLSPEPGRTEAQQNAAYAAYASLNAQIRALCAAAPTTRILADLAALTGGSRTALLDRIIARAQRPPDVTTVVGGGALPNVAGGHKVTSFRSIQDFNALWSTNPPFVNGVMGASTDAKDMSAAAVVDGVNTFVRDVQAIVPWFWVWCATGHASTNTCIELRNGFGMGLHSTQGWRPFFQGARMGGASGTDNAYVSTPGGAAPTGTARQGYRVDGITSWVAASGNQGIEVWPADTEPSRGVLRFLGGLNRELMANSLCFLVGVQARLAKIDPSSADDSAQSRFVVTCGVDFTTPSPREYGRYDRYSFPLTVMDGGSCQWEIFRATDWTAVTSITIGRTTAMSAGLNADEHYADPGTPPPLGNWSPATPYNDIGARSISITQLRANPPPLPDYWDGSGGAGSGWLVTDFWTNPSTGNRDIHWLQSGADKAAGVISRAIITSGALGGGGVISGLLLGLPAKPNVFVRTESSLKGVALKSYDANTLPTWPPTLLPVATVGVAFTATVLANGSPAPTYSFVSGNPGWLSINSTTGALTGTPTGGTTSHSVVVRATNAAGTADVTLTLSVVASISIVTSSLPGAVRGSAYSATLESTGTAPVTWAITAGALPTGLSLNTSTGVISGTPSVEGTSAFTVRVTDADTRAVSRSLSIAVVQTGSAPTIGTLSLPDAVMGVAYSEALAASGTPPITWAVTSGSLPVGVELNAVTGVIGGVPLRVEAAAFIVTATNAVGSATGALTINVAAPETPDPNDSRWVRIPRDTEVWIRVPRDDA